MKFIKVLLIIFLLSGCSNIYDQNIKTYDLNSELDDIFSNTNKSEALLNNYSKYMDYYLPYEVEEDSCDSLSSVYTLGNGKLVMNINVSGIINGKYSDDGFFDENKKIYSSISYFVNRDDNNEKYTFCLYQYEDDYLLYFIDKEIIFYGYTYSNEVVLMAQKIFDIAKSISISDEDVIDAFSSSETIDYQKTYVNLFQTVMPTEGRIDEFIIE